MFLDLVTSEVLVWFTFHEEQERVSKIYTAGLTREIC
jgi:hypothetical protein